MRWPSREVLSARRTPSLLFSHALVAFPPDVLARILALARAVDCRPGADRSMPGTPLFGGCSDGARQPYGDGGPLRPVAGPRFAPRLHVPRSGLRKRCSDPASQRAQSLLNRSIHRRSYFRGRERPPSDGCGRFPPSSNHRPSSARLKTEDREHSDLFVFPATTNHSIPAEGNKCQSKLAQRRRTSRSSRYFLLRPRWRRTTITAITTTTTVHFTSPIRFLQSRRALIQSSDSIISFVR